MSPLRRHIFVCFMAKSAFWGVFGLSSVHRGRTHIVLVPPLLHTLKIRGAGVYSPRRQEAEFVVFLSVMLRCQAQKVQTVRIRTELGGNGHKDPGQFQLSFQFSFSFSFSFQFSFYNKRRHILLQRQQAIEPFQLLKLVLLSLHVVSTA